MKVSQVKVTKEIKSKQVTSFLVSSANLIFLISGESLKGKYFQDMSVLML